MPSNSNHVCMLVCFCLFESYVDFQNSPKLKHNIFSTFRMSFQLRGLAIFLLTQLFKKTSIYCEHVIDSPFNFETANKRFL